MCKFVTTNLRFSEATFRDLKYQAGRRGVAVAFLVREAVDRYLGRTGEDTALPLGSDPADALIGCVAASAGDESVDHDHYLYGWPREGTGEAAGGHEALLALAMRDDKHHGAAVQFVRSHPHARLVLAELVVVEVATRVRARAGAAQAAALARSLLESRRYELLFVDLDLLRGAIERMARFADKPAARRGRHQDDRLHAGGAPRLHALAHRGGAPELRHVGEPTIGGVRDGRRLFARR